MSRGEVKDADGAEVDRHDPGLVLVGLAVLVLVFDWNWIKGFVEREASQRRGARSSLRVILTQLSRLPLVRLDHIRIANAPGARALPAHAQLGCPP